MFEKEISNGVELLNKINPGWVDKINLEELDMASSSKCIIGQLYGCYCIAMPKIERDHNCDRLDLAFSSYGSNITTKEWKQAILNLRSNNNILQSDILDSIPEKLYSKEEVKLLLEDVMNIGMNLRQDQITGNTKRTGREVLEEFIKTKL
jgi:hypothetical protein